MKPTDFGYAEFVNRVQNLPSNTLSGKSVNVLSGVSTTLLDVVRTQEAEIKALKAQSGSFDLFKDVQEPILPLVSLTNDI